MAQPSVTISLAPDGSLELRLPGSGSDRVIPLRETSSVNPTETIRRVLLSQAQQKTAIGEDGAPTRAQVQHWEKHFMFPDARCAFCQFDKALIRGLSPRCEGDDTLVARMSHMRDARYAERKLGSGGVTVRVIAPAKVKGQGKGPKADTFISGRSSDDLEF